jgi:hypothetical protein
MRFGFCLVDVCTLPPSDPSCTCRVRIFTPRQPGCAVSAVTPAGR